MARPFYGAGRRNGSLGGFLAPETVNIYSWVCPDTAAIPLELHEFFKEMIKVTGVC